MSKEAIIENTIKLLQMLPDEKVKEVCDFADFMLKKQEDLNLQKGIQMIQSNSSAFNFLEEDEELYSLHDIKEEF